jgi:gamma-glutamylcyclotransferase (GGCT)/AIG2-like uncharacterized protein YtfP
VKNYLKVEEESIRDYVFVYGTLKRREKNHYLLKHSEFIGVGAASNFACTNTSAFPYAFKKKGHVLKGEVYLVDANTMMQLDILEGYPDLYNRKRALVSVKGEKPILAWIYFVDPEQVEHEIKEYGYSDYWGRAPIEKPKTSAAGSGTKCYLCSADMYIYTKKEFNTGHFELICLDCNARLTLEDMGGADGRITY